MKIKMNITSGDYAQRLAVYRRQQLASAAPTSNRSGLMLLGSPIISRIHNIKPGCSSCGK
jgi:hypothetical protein